MRDFENACGSRQSAGVAKLLVVLVTTLLGPLLPSLAQAQGCIVARSAQLTTDAGTGRGYLAPHHWQLTIDYRHQYSFRHYIGDVEQTQRIQMGNEVENRVNLQNFQLTYQATPRLEFWHRAAASVRQQALARCLQYFPRQWLWGRHCLSADLDPESHKAAPGKRTDWLRAADAHGCQQSSKYIPSSANRDLNHHQTRGLFDPARSRRLGNCASGTSLQNVR